jgi:fluoroacetyl-CoA thioesterase
MEHNMNQPIQPGLFHEIARTVEERHLASAWGSGLAPVLATPMLVTFCEECARLAVDPLLPEGEQTVGTEIHMRHLAATPAGMTVTLRAELLEVDGRRLRFHIEAWDPIEKVGEAEHERFIIDTARFERRMAEKRTHTPTVIPSPAEESPRAPSGGPTGSRPHR